MYVRETALEQIDETTFRLVAIIELRDHDGFGNERGDPLGEGPTGDAVPDRIVRYLIDCDPAQARIADIKEAVGGHPGTVQRQAWTLANNAPDLQLRLRGWVCSPQRGAYALTPEARARISRRRT